VSGITRILLLRALPTAVLQVLHVRPDLLYTDLQYIREKPRERRGGDVLRSGWQRAAEAVGAEVVEAEGA
jgi:hypothetical protein